ncbi:MAG TPA: DUF5680 domain-containing protein [Candidatus Saccharimonadales bacterium]|nr:DUF5680 domain-containing protein [Candidatus Saccharimonadales bacterium]
MDLQSLNNILGKAALATYAGGGKRIETEKKGFFDMEYREGDFYYRDSFAGYLSSHGQETVWYKDKPVWMCSYAGGMRGSKTDDPDFAHDTFEFLKKAMRTGEKSKEFQPRGPKHLTDGEWKYKNDCSGDISNFKGHEEITYQGEFVFEHDYFGGVLKGGRRG